MATARILAFDFSFSPLVAVLVEGGTAKASLDAHAGCDRGEMLVAELARLLARAGVGWQEIDLFAVARGPGSFTGIRAAVAAARGLSLATGRPVLPLSSLEVLEAEARARAATEGPLYVVAPGRHGSWYAQLFARSGLAAGPPELVDAASLRERVRAASAVAGVRSGRLADELGDRPVVEVTATAQALLRVVTRALAEGRAAVAGAEMDPLYLRDADADPKAGLPLLERLGLGC
ncbi:tRNA threonylcarbamoyladenosine biosynthesis protein TsaB [bacterium HR40]|nr:tRNA threonylcarbamoyladenosine biosynthesis protein TsaB [bacterium HR40]